MADILPQFAQYAWFLPAGTVIAFIMGAGMGANELSSNWGSVFGSRVLKLWQIVILAAIFEFTGALMVGESVASAIKDGVINRKQFIPVELLMLGMLVVLITAASWLIIANYFAIPVSDSQTTVLALVGIGLAFNPSTIIVGTSVFSSKGLLKIISAWLVSPISAALVGILLYSIIKKLILEHTRSLDRLFKTFPLFIFITVFVNFWFFLLETEIIELEWWGKLVGGLVAGLVVTLGANFTYVKYLQRRVTEIRDKASLIPDKADEYNGFSAKVDKTLASFPLTRYLAKDYHAEALKDEKLQHVYEETISYPEEIEYLFKHLLIATACFKSFAHGASDVGNSIGPLAGIIEILTKGVTEDKAPFPLSIKFIGAASMAVGIITFGYRALVTLGIKVTRVTPAKGIAIDLASAIVVIVTAYLKIPISSTQTQVGAILGVSLVSGSHGAFKSTNWKQTGIIVLIWILNLAISMGLAYGLFNFVARSPKI
jgi:sodium-dependent phosphate transporter